METPWFVVVPGLSVVIKDMVTEQQRVHFNIKRVTCRDAKVTLVNSSGNIVYPASRYHVASIKHQQCAQ